MTLNPEFRRNLWLELTPQRLIMMPVVLGLIFVIGAQAGSAADEVIASLANFVFGLLVLLWGCRRAAASVANEVREGTWDWQRMSAIDPWSMAWGKLLGAAAFVWYGGLICLAALIYAYGPKFGPLVIATFVASIVMAGLIGHCVSLAASLAWLRKTRPTRRLPVTLCHVLGLGIGYYLMTWAVAFSPVELEKYTYFGAGPSRTEIAWYGGNFGAHLFALVSLALFLAWGLLAVHRLMRAELQVKQWPWAWPLLTLFSIVYLNGWFVGSIPGFADTLFLPAYIGFTLAVGMAYLILLVESKDVVRLRGLVAAIAAGSWGRAASLSPSWLPSVMLAALFGAGVMGLSGDIPSFDVFSDRYDIPIQPSSTLALAGVVTVLAFLVRDFALILALNFGDRRKRADLAALVYLGVLYGLIPVMLFAVGQEWAWLVFWPFHPNQPWINLAFAAAQAGLALAFMVWRWRLLQATLLAPRPQGG